MSIWVLAMLESKVYRDRRVLLNCLYSTCPKMASMQVMHVLINWPTSIIQFYFILFYFCFCLYQMHAVDFAYIARGIFLAHASNTYNVTEPSVQVLIRNMSFRRHCPFSLSFLATSLLLAIHNGTLRRAHFIHVHFISLYVYTIPVHALTRDVSWKIVGIKIGLSIDLTVFYRRLRYRDFCFINF